ncbi:MAG: hypothetical protein JO323_11745 [Acidobacteriia bacterium]|nr:hypothetical protein [Terriglobia bacterium]
MGSAPDQAQKRAFPWLATAVFTLFVYWICLRFLFPGYFAPLSPFHIDFYDYAGAAALKLIQLLTRYPRPVAYLAMHFMGTAGLSGLMAGEVALALGNVLLTACLVRFVFRVDSLWMLGALPAYLILLFAHPQFYFEHRHDLPAEVSYLFLILSLLAWISAVHIRNPRGWPNQLRRSVLLAGSFLSALLFAFSKETYFASALVLVAGLALVDTENRRRHLGFLEFLAIAELASISWTRHINSPFIGAGTGAEGSYHVSLSVTSLADTGWFYLSHLFNPALVLLCLMTLLVVKWNRSGLVFAGACMAAGCAVLLPHAVLPNHRFEEYAWAALPLLLAPVLLVGSTATAWRRAALQFGLLAVLTIAAVAGPFGYESAYSDPTLTWQVGQDRRGAALAESLHVFRELPEPAHILIVGLDDAAVPWQASGFILAEFGDRRYWTVVLPVAADMRHQSSIVRFAEANSIRLENYEYVATYKPDGNLAAFENARALANPAAVEVVVPALSPFLASARAQPTDPGPWLNCAQLAVEWGLWPEAGEYLGRAITAGARDASRIAQLRAAIRDRPAGAAPAGELSANPSHVVAPDGLAMTELSWKASENTAVEIHIDAPDGPLFAATRGPGHARTDRWVRNGMRFFLQDVSQGRPLTPENTLASTKIDVSP